MLLAPAMTSLISLVLMESDICVHVPYIGLDLFTHLTL